MRIFAQTVLDMKLRQVPLEKINAFRKDTLMEVLDISCVELGDDYIVATMPVDHRTHQPMGLLHGGASAALIESVGSMGSTLLLDLSKEAPVGIEINANHIGNMKSGVVKAVGKIVHAGKRTHLWQVDLYDQETGKLICTGRLTIMIVPVA
jgi:1,4-dihydroxy-2-naphthoyl-CoA hydrolase